MDVKVTISEEQLKKTVLEGILSNLFPEFEEPENEFEAQIGANRKTLIGRVEEYVKAEALERVQEAMGPAVQEKVKTEIEKAAAVGFFTVDPYGRKTDAKTINQMVHECFQKKERNGGYNSPERTWVEWIVREAVEDHMKREMAEELANVRKQFRSAIEAKFTEAAAEALKQSLLGR